MFIQVVQVTVTSWDDAIKESKTPEGKTESTDITVSCRFKLLVK